MRSKAIVEFLKANGVNIFAQRYSADMEVQVQVAQGDGERQQEGSFIRYTDGIETWANFRMPKNSMSEPEANDWPLKWNFDKHVDAIGMTGWDYANGVSRWVGYDFDSIIGHKDVGLTDIELKELQESVQQLEWVTIIRSTSGNGLHVYVELPEVTTENHTEHAALSRAMLARMSALTGYDFDNSVDVCGQILWVWAARSKGNKRAFETIKTGRKLLTDEVPINWKDHLNVVKGTSRRSRVGGGKIPDGTVSEMEMLTGQYPKIPLDDTHKALIKYLDDNERIWAWDKDMHMLITHTVHLKEAHVALGMRGVFETSSSHSSEQNCFCYPLIDGAWVVRRYGKSVNEHVCWDIDERGWTKTYFNQKPTLHTVAKLNDGQEHSKGGYYFHQATSAQKALAGLGMQMQVTDRYKFEEARVFLNNKNKVIVEIPKRDKDSASDLPGFIPEGRKFTKVVGSLFEAPSEPIPDCDDTIRHLVSVNAQDAGWSIFSQDKWREEPLQHVRIFLDSTGLSQSESKEILGQCVANPWFLTNKPFQPEYPGGRQWNRDAAKLNYEVDKTKKDLSYPTWQSILEHCGECMDAAIQDNTWCQNNGVTSGQDYLMLWCASLFQYPERPLPYLFFYGDQNSGKSTFHEALELLFNRGYVLAKQALTNPNGFNGELQGSVLCVVEEVDLSVASSLAYNRIKEWVTNKQMLIHPKGKQAYQVENTTHWVQCANSHKYCPIFKDDSRIVVIETKELSPSQLMPRYELIEKLIDEASDFLTALMKIEVPHSRARLNLPVIETSSKSAIIQQNMNALEAFLDQKCIEVVGSCVKFSTFYDKFMAYCDPVDQGYWSKNQVSRSLPIKFPSGGLASKANQKYIGNLAFQGEDCMPGTKRYITSNNKLVLGD